LLLDSTGDPNHVANLRSAPILADIDGDVLHFQSSYAYVGHFSRFVCSGARRFRCACKKQILACAAFSNTDQRIAEVVLNRSEQAQEYPICYADISWNAHLPPRSIAIYQFSRSGALID
jgi:glucosylceramidase